MKWLIFLTLIIVSLAEGDVVVLTDENFEQYLKSSPIMMVKFFAPWCGHCKTFAPEYEKAAKMAKQQGKSYVLGELDATVHKITADKHGVQSFPTIKLFLNGSAIPYNSDRTADAVLAFIAQKTKPITTELKSPVELIGKKESKGLKVRFTIKNIFIVYSCGRNPSNYALIY